MYDAWRQRLSVMRCGIGFLLCLLLTAHTTSSFALGQSDSQVSPDDAEWDSQQLEQQVQKIIEQWNPVVVQIEMTGLLSADRGKRTGTRIDSQGYLLTHATGLTQKPDTILVNNGNGPSQIAQWVAVDHLHNLVLLKTEPVAIPEFDNLAVDQIQTGQSVIALGKWLAADSVHVSSGIVSAKGRIWGKAVQTDAKVGPLNFGGPLLDLQGRMVGLLTPLSMDVQQNHEGQKWYDSGIGFAVSLAELKGALESMKTGKDRLPGQSGFDFQQTNWNVDSFPISSVIPGSPAFGILQPGDQITQINGHSVDCLAAFYDQYYRAAAGDSIQLAFQRGDQNLTSTITLVDQLAPLQFQVLGCLLAESDTGLEVLSATGNQLQIGDLLLKINGMPVTSRLSIRQTLASLSWPPEPVSLDIQRDGQPKSLALTPQSLKQWQQPESWDAILQCDPPVDYETQTVSTAELDIAAQLQHCRSEEFPSVRPIVILVSDSLQTTESLSNAWQEPVSHWGLPLLVMKPQGKTWTEDDVDCLELLRQQAVLQHPDWKSRSMVILGIGDGCATAINYAATHKEMVAGLAVIPGSESAEVLESILQWENDPQGRVLLAMVHQQTPTALTEIPPHLPLTELLQDSADWQMQLLRWMIRTQVE